MRVVYLVICVFALNVVAYDRTYIDDYKLCYDGTRLVGMNDDFTCPPGFLTLSEWHATCNYSPHLFVIRNTVLGEHMRIQFRAPFNNTITYVQIGNVTLNPLPHRPCAESFVDVYLPNNLTVGLHKVILVTATWDLIETSISLQIVCPRKPTFAVGFAYLDRSTVNLIPLRGLYVEPITNVLLYHDALLEYGTEKTVVPDSGEIYYALPRVALGGSLHMLELIESTCSNCTTKEALCYIKVRLPWNVPLGPGQLIATTTSKLHVTLDDVHVVDLAVDT